jgi:hypothetical protein
MRRGRGTIPPAAKRLPWSAVNDIPLGTMSDAEVALSPVFAVAGLEFFRRRSSSRSTSLLGQQVELLQLLRRDGQGHPCLGRKFWVFHENLQVRDRRLQSLQRHFLSLV